MDPIRRVTVANELADLSIGIREAAILGQVDFFLLDRADHPLPIPVLRRIINHHHTHRGTCTSECFDIA